MVKLKETNKLQIFGSEVLYENFVFWEIFVKKMNFFMFFLWLA